MLVTAAHELMQGEGDFVGMRCAPRNDALQLDGIVGDGTDFHQLGFDRLRVSHRNSEHAICRRLESLSKFGQLRAGRYALSQFSSIADPAMETLQGKNLGGVVGYRGPRTRDVKLDLRPDATRANVLKAIDGHILGKGVMAARFHR